MSDFKERDALIKLIATQGIQHYKEEHPVTNRLGDPLLWVMNMLGATLDGDGLELAARGMLHLLARFEGRQIATMGSAAAPLLSACVLLSKGHYNGLLVRTQRKAYGTGNLIDGNIRPDEPVIVIDDSIGSGSNLLKCIEHLESEGLNVEGAACLVQVHWYSGYPVLLSRGYRVECLLERKQDIEPLLAAPTHAPETPQNIGPWHPTKAPENLSPIDLVREVIKTYLSTGMVLRPPDQTLFSQCVAGGLWISIRSAKNPQQRFARGGYIRFPEQAPERFTEALTHAAVLTAQQMAQQTDALCQLDQTLIAITCYGALEPCSPLTLDHERRGVVVRSATREETCGGALPNVPGIVNNWQQFEHARSHNAKLEFFEPYQCYRHKVYKVSDATYPRDVGGEPLPDGPIWQSDIEYGGAIARYLNSALKNAFGQKTSPPVFECTLPPTLEMLFLSLYQEGQMLGCIGSEDCHNQSALDQLAQWLVRDIQQRDVRAFELKQPYVLKVHLLTKKRDLGAFSVSAQLPIYSFGREALAVEHGHKFALITSDVPLLENFDSADFCAEVIDKAGVTRAPYQWSAWRDDIWWIDERQSPEYLNALVLPRSADKVSLSKWQKYWTNYLQQQCSDFSRLYCDYLPFKNQLLGKADKSQCAELAWFMVKTQSASKLPAVKDFFQVWYLANVAEAAVAEPATIEDREQLQYLCFMLMIWCELDLPTAQQHARPFAESIMAVFNPHGHIHHCQVSGIDANDPARVDPIPGITLLTLAILQKKDVFTPPKKTIKRSLRHYRQRALVVIRAGPCHWLLQAFALWANERNDPSLLDVLEQYARSAQAMQQTDGGCLSLAQPEGASSSTAWTAMTFALAARCGQNKKTRARYAKACHDALLFLVSLSLDARYASTLLNPEYASSGILRSAFDARINIAHVATAALAARHYLLLGHKP